jgi:thiamine-monophosphate kinase
MNEFELIALLKPRMTTHDGVVTGCGDDCAVLDQGGGPDYLLFKTDAVVEDIHFTAETEPERVGHKALARCLSDIAAMGGTPTAAVVTLAIPPSCTPEWVLHLYDGLNALATRHGVAIVGGETTTLPHARLISVSVVGKVQRDQVLHRSGAHLGDAIFVTGELGGSIEGHHLDFEPRLDAGRWLAQLGYVRCMIDVSDGIAGDLPHLLAASHVPGAQIHASALPIRRAAKERARQGDQARPATAAALLDGEDFELLFTVPPSKAVDLLDRWKETFPSIRLSCIGKIINEPGMWLVDTNGRHPLPHGGYQHFKDSVVSNRDTLVAE